MRPHSEQPDTALPTRRSLREAERRAASEPTPVVAPRPDPDSSTAAHHVPSWAHHAPVPTPDGGPATEALAAPTRSAWSTTPARAIVPELPARIAGPARPASAAARPAAPAPSAPPAAPAPSARPVVPTQSAAQVTQVLAPVVGRPSPQPEVVSPAVEDVPELAGVEHGSGRRHHGRPTRAAARLCVLGVLAGITVVVPVSQGIVPGPVAFGSDALADSTLPDTVSALAGSSLSALPPTSLVSTDGALQARGLLAASRTEERSALPGCDGAIRATGQNGLLKTADLCTMWDNHTQLRADAAVSLAEFNQAFAARFGGDLCLSSGYRTLASQRTVKAQKGGLAAVPGKSNHGWGLAIDLCQDQTSGVKWRWINENGPTYGWENPAWAQPGGSGPFERWHWEYTKGVQADGEYYDG